MEANSSYIALSVLVILFIKLLFSYVSNRRNNLPPSPPALPIIGHLYLFKKKPLHRTLAKLSASRGPILFLRFGSRPVLVVSSASLAEECFTKNDVAFASRPQLPTAKHLSYNYTTIGTASYGPRWRNIRRIATVEVLSAHRLNSFSDIRTSEVRAMVRGLVKDAAASGGDLGRVEIRPRLFGLSLNVIMTMVAGRRFYGEGSGSEEARWFREMVEMSFSLAGASNVQAFLPVMKWFDFRGLNKKLARLGKQRDEFLQGLIEEHRRESGAEEKKRTMIGELLAMQKSDPEYYTDAIIKALIISLLMAGTDTSSVTIEWALSLLLNSPETLKKARDEINNIVGKDRLPEESDLPKLPYLHCIITETLRLYPASPLLVPHYSTEECTVGGYTIPSGTMLLCNAYAIHRDGVTWAEPTKFIPERFEGEKDKGAGGNLMIPFGMGRRRCPGEGLAMKVVGLELGTLIQCFEWKRVGKELVEMGEGSGLTMPKSVPLEALYRPRECMIDVLTGV